MKKLLLASVALFGVAGGAMAADLPARRAAPVFTPVPVFTWTGFYIGVNAGAAFRDDDRRDRIDVPFGTFNNLGVNAGATAGTLALDGGRNESTGFTGGGQIGFNWQTGMFVWGVEADAQYVDLGRDRNGTLSYSVTQAGADARARGVFVGTVLPLQTGTATFHPASLSDIEWFGTVRGRLGIAMDRTLIYATGGFAYGGGGDDCGFAGCRNGDNDWRTGWTVGGGLEYAFTNNITAKIEGLYVDLGDHGRRNYIGSVVDVNGTVTDIEVAGAGRRRHDDFAVVRAGLNFKFGSW